MCWCAVWCGGGGRGWTAGPHSERSAGHDEPVIEPVLQRLRACRHIMDYGSICSNIILVGMLAAAVAPRHRLSATLASLASPPT